MAESNTRNTKTQVIKPIKVIEKRDKNVVSTSIFFPETFLQKEPINYIKLNYKHVTYVLGLIKSVITIKKNLPGWILRIYYDDMFESENLNGQFSKIYSLYKKNRNEITTDIKTENYYKLFLINLMSKFIEKIKANEGGEYDHVELFNFNSPKNKTDKENYGHKSTFGSIFRFHAFFDESVANVFSINSSHPISLLLADEIKKWMDNKEKQIIGLFYRNTNFESKFINELDDHGMMIWYAAGLFGIKKNMENPPLFTKNYIKEKYNEFEKYICEKCNYGIDEVYLGTLFSIKNYKDLKSNNTTETDEEMMNTFFNHIYNLKCGMTTTFAFFNGYGDCKDGFKTIYEKEVKPEQNLEFPYNYYLKNPSFLYNHIKKKDINELDIYKNTTNIFIYLINIDEENPLIINFNQDYESKQFFNSRDDIILYLKYVFSKHRLCMDQRSNCKAEEMSDEMYNQKIDSIYDTWLDFTIIDVDTNGETGESFNNKTVESFNSKTKEILERIIEHYTGIKDGIKFNIIECKPSSRPHRGGGRTNKLKKRKNKRKKNKTHKKGKNTYKKSLKNKK